mgnify:CR=1 FL=1
MAGGIGCVSSYRHFLELKRGEKQASSQKDKSKNFSKSCRKMLAFDWQRGQGQKRKSEPASSQDPSSASSAKRHKGGEGDKGGARGQGDEGGRRHADEEGGDKHGDGGQDRGREVRVEGRELPEEAKGGRWGGREGRIVKGARAGDNTPGEDQALHRNHTDIPQHARPRAAQHHPQPVPHTNTTHPNTRAVTTRLHHSPTSIWRLAPPGATVPR